MSEAMPLDAFDESSPDIRRYTSQEVLTDGVAQGWADPDNYLRINFTKRPSFVGDVEFDDRGRPLNPHRTADMPGDRGELGKWGVNNAADPVVIALGEDGKRHILLIKRRDTEQWALPGGMVDPGEHVSATAKRELLEETGVDLQTVPSKVIYQGFVDDPRNTRNAWMETVASLMIVHHTTEVRPDKVETCGAAWFDVDTLDLDSETSDLYASHAAIIQQAKNEVDSFNSIMKQAQILHGKGDFAQAKPLWSAAQGILPDPLENGRALRGEAASLARLQLHTQAAVKAREALALHDDAVASHGAGDGTIEAHLSALRYRAESRAVLGRILLSPIVNAERTTTMTPGEARQEAEESLAYLNDALQDIVRVEAATHRTDQHKINMLSRLAIAHALYGEKQQAKQLSWQAMKAAWFAEAPGNSTSAHISLSHTLRAKGRAIPRAYAGAVGVRLATSHPSRRRQMALGIAADGRVGL
jgi:ADP-ribose pyrophosphatase